MTTTLPPAIAIALCVHLAVQLAVTVDFHDRRVAADPDVPERWLSIGCVITTCAQAVGISMRYLTIEYRGLALMEVIYRVFMGFYGLVFPAYVWLCMIPGRGRVVATRHQLMVFVAAVLLAAPMFWMGFGERMMIWLLPGVAIVLLARLFIPASAPARVSSSPRTAD